MTQTIRTPRRAISTSIGRSIYDKGKGSICVSIDRTRLLVDLLTFDRVVIHSPHYGEVPFLTKLFGFEGFKELLESGVINISSNNVALMLDKQVNGNRVPDFNTFPQKIIMQQSNADACGHNLLQVTGLKRRDADDLVQAIIRQDSELPGKFAFDVHAQIRRDLNLSDDFLRAILLRDFPSLKTDKVQVSAVNVENDALRIQTNLRDLLGIEPLQEHSIVSAIYGAVANVNLTLSRMQFHDAIKEFSPNDSQLLFGKLAGILSPLNPKLAANSFLRVLELADIPQALDLSSIRVEDLLKVRESNECREFRAWLTTADNLNDTELKRVLTGFRASAASFLSSGAGKTIRLAVNSALGLLPGYGTVVSLAEGAVDMFLLDRMLPSSGVLTFLRQSLPSILK